MDLVWRGQGGPVVSSPTREGFGPKLLDRLAPHELNTGWKGSTGGWPGGAMAVRLSTDSRFRSYL